MGPPNSPIRPGRPNWANNHAINVGVEILGPGGPELPRQARFGIGYTGNIPTGSNEFGTQARFGLYRDITKGQFGFETGLRGYTLDPLPLHEFDLSASGHLQDWRWQGGQHRLGYKHILGPDQTIGGSFGRRYDPDSHEWLRFGDIQYGLNHPGGHKITGRYELSESPQDGLQSALSGDYRLNDPRYGNLEFGSGLKWQGFGREPVSNMSLLLNNHLTGDKKPAYLWEVGGALERPLFGTPEGEEEPERSLGYRLFGNASNPNIFRENGFRSGFELASPLDPEKPWHERFNFDAGHLLDDDKRSLWRGNLLLEDCQNKPYRFQSNLGLGDPDLFLDTFQPNRKSMWEFLPETLRPKE